MAWRLLRAGLACSGTRCAAVHPQHAKHTVAPCCHSSAASAAGPSRHAPSRSCGLAFLSRATASSCGGAAHRLVGTAASTDSAPSPAPAEVCSDKVQGMDVSTAAVPSATATPQAAGSITGVLAACKGSGGPTEALDQLLKLDEALETGHAQSWALKEQPVEYLLAFRALAEFEPQDIKGNPELRQAAAAARRSLMHGAAAAFVSYAPNVQLPVYLAAALLACSKVGYGWASDGDAAAEAEVPLAAVVLKRLGELAEAPDGLRNLEYSSWVSITGDHVVPYDQRDMHSCLWEAMAAAPPGVAAAHARLLDASAHTVVHKGYSGAVTHPMLKALAQLHPLVRKAGPLGRCLVYSVNLYDAPDLPDQELCEAVEAVGELLLNAPTFRRELMSRDGDVMPGILRMLLNEARRRLKKSVRMRAVDADAAAQRSMAARWPAHPVSKMETQTLLRLLRGLTMISEACSAEASMHPGSSSSSSSIVLSLCRNWSGDDSDFEYYDYDTDYEEDLYDGNPPQDVALQAAATAQYVASALEGGAFRTLSPKDLSDLAVWFARAGYGTSDNYRNLVSAATSSKAFSECADPAHWAQLWRALALVRHRPDDALVRCTAAAMTKQQQYGSAKAEDCATLLLSLAELRCYDGGLVEVLLCRLVQLAGGGGGAEVRDMTNAVWAVAVMGPEALWSHCGAVGQLLRKVVAEWEQGRVIAGVGSQEQLRQLWQVQLELEGLVDGVAGSSGGSSSSSSPGQLRDVLPPDLLRAAEEAAGEGPGCVHSSSRLLQRLRDEVCSVLRGMVQQGGGQQARQGAQGQQRAGGKMATAVEGDCAAADVAAGPVPSCTILAVIPEAAVPELRCTADVVVELGGGRRVAVEVEGPGRLLTNHPHTETRTGRAELRRRQLERVLGSGNVVGVSHWAWEELDGDKGRQEAWLCGLLADGPGAGAEGNGGESKGW